MVSATAPERVHRSRRCLGFAGRPRRTLRHGGRNLWIGSYPHLGAGVHVVRDHLRAPLAGRSALLGEPTAFGPDRAVWCLVNNGWEQPYNFGGERALPAYEVMTRAACAWCRYPQDLPRVNGMRELQEILRHGCGVLQEVDARLIDAPSDHSDELRSLRLRLRTGA
jgi:hypothetical protein